MVNRRIHWVGSRACAFPPFLIYSLPLTLATLMYRVQRPAETSVIAKHIKLEEKDVGRECTGKTDQH